MRENRNNALLVTRTAGRKFLQRLRGAIGSRPPRNSLAVYRVAPVAAMLAAFLMSSVAIAFDNHDFACPKPQCSICEVKKVYKGTPKKTWQDPVFLSSPFWGSSERFHPRFLATSAEHASPLSHHLFRESSRAPPFLA